MTPTPTRKLWRTTAGFVALVWTGWQALAAAPPAATLPRRDLLVELRQVSEGSDSGEEGPAYSVATEAPGGQVVPQQVRVQNGEKAQLRMTQSLTLQWVQSASAQRTAVTAGAASASQSGGAMTQASSTVEAGQTLVLTPRWPGGSRPVSVVVDLQTAVLEERTGADLPAVSRHQVLTTVTVPLRQWTTVATSGSRSTGGSYRSAGAADTPRLLQIRISTP